MELILLENIMNLGNIGDKVQVKPGYGRNFLLKTGKALRLNKENGYVLNITQGDYEIIDYELGGVENAIKIYQAQ